MKLYILITILQIVIVSVFNKLISVVEVNRHGARTPKNFPEQSSKLFYGSSNMQLTFNGFRQLQTLGEYMKNKYIKKKNFLKAEYDEKEFKMISSPTQRTIFSSTGLLAGLYPDYIVKLKPNNHLRNNDIAPIGLDKTMKIKEIPVDVRDIKKDSLFHALNCKYNKKTLDEYIYVEDDIFILSDEDINTAIGDMKEYLDIKEGQIHKNKDSNHTHSHDHVLKELAKFLPSFSYHYPYYNKTMRNDTILTLKKFNLNRWYKDRLDDNKYLRLSISEFFDKMTENFKHSIEMYKKNKQLGEYKEDYQHLKLVSFSGHDTVLVNIIANLLESEYLKKMIKDAVYQDDLYNFLVPEFAANIFFELHHSIEEDLYYVNILYNGEPLFKGLKYMKENKVNIDFTDFSKLMNKLVDKTYRSLDCSGIKNNSI